MGQHGQYFKLGAAVVAVGIALALVGVIVAGRPHFQGAPQHESARPTPPAPAEPPKPTTTAAIAKIAAPALRADLERLYAASGDKLMWSGDAAAQRRLRDLSVALDVIPAHGIDGRKATAARDALQTADVDAAQGDVALTAQVLMLARALRFGQVPDAQIEDWHVAGDAVDIVPDLAAALTSEKIDAFLRTLPPNDINYTKLVESLARYRALAAAGGWPQIASDGALKIDPTDPRIEVLQRRLIAEGYVVQGAGLSKASLSEALTVFQAHNGLAPDGRAGKDTLTALNVSAEERVGQIVANLERRRHLPRAVPEDRITVNTADQSMVLYTGGAPALQLRTIVGARKHPTPMLALTLAAVTLNPTWEIPPSIARKEILPHLQRDPNYLAANDMVIVDGPQGDPQGLHVNWKHYSAMPWRLRQNSGARNSLGQLKFEMWNSYSIYLHDTPARQLFANTDRYLSHGCVRVDQSRELARHVLMSQPGWDAEALAAAIATGEKKMIRLKRAIPVQLMYWTAFVDDAGQLQFRADAYRRDAPLAEMLGHPPKRAAAPVALQTQSATVFAPRGHTNFVAAHTSD